MARARFSTSKTGRTSSDVGLRYRIVDSRIEDGSYGFCEVSGEEIGLRRLEARPIASMTVEAQERHERTEGHFADAR